MRFFGLHPLDIGIVIAFLAAIIWISVAVARSVKQQSDFFLGGRTLGKWLQFFLNFGNMTDSTGAVQTTSTVYRSGISGIWLGFQTLFITPFYWFSTVWFRRMRMITMADLFVDRFDSKGLASAYALFNIALAFWLIAMGNVASYGVAKAMIKKAPSDYTAAEKLSVDQFHEFDVLRAEAVAGALPEASKARFEQLRSLNELGKLHSSISYVNDYFFYISYSLFIAFYIIIGGLRATAICAGLQGILVIFMSLVLIPFGLVQLGGFSQLHAILDWNKFRIFGDPLANDYTWYSILAITFASMIQIFGLIHNTTISGSAKDENAARIGALSGGFAKRLILIAWGLCGLIALAYFTRNGGLSDTNEAWGGLSSALLPVGLIGLMLAGMLLGHMPAVAAAAVSISALITRNVYEPLVKDASKEHYVRIGQLIVFLVLAAAVPVSIVGKDVVEMYILYVTFNVYFGAVVVLVVYWRRITSAAIALGLVIWVLLIGVIPAAVAHIGPLATSGALTRQSNELRVTVASTATQQDVAEGRGAKIGDPIQKLRVILPASLFFEKGVPLIDPNNVNSGRRGIGRFQAELYLLSVLGVPVETMKPADLTTARWAVDGLLPFIMLIFFSLFTPQSKPELALRFHAKMKTPIGGDPEDDRRRMELSLADPARFDHLKLFPNSNWEFCKWTREDFVGFSACWGIVLAILLVLIALMRIGA